MLHFFACEMHGRLFPTVVPLNKLRSIMSFIPTLRRIFLVTLLCSAFAHSLKAQVVMAGDPGFDSDSLKNAEAGQWRWLCFPGGRLSLNPAPGKAICPTAKWDIPPLGEKLPLDIGAFAGTKAVRLMNLVTIGLSAPGRAPEFSCSRSTAWFPYKLSFDSAFPCAARIKGTDFFTTAKDAVMRVLEIEGAKGKLLRLGGTTPQKADLQWDATGGVLLIKHPEYVCEIKVIRLSGPSQTPAALNEEPKVDAQGWALDLPLETGSGAFGVAIGFASTVEGPAKAAERVASAVSQPPSANLAKSKAVMDDYLRKVPAPQKGGVKDAVGEISAEQHRRAYYAAWAFNYQNLIDVFPEAREYPFPQFSVGKASLWDEGEKTAPTTCGWESLFAYQWNAFVDPELSWKAYMGLMTRVDKEGVLGGESLPSRKAQTAWILHQRKPDMERLKRVYPALKRYLLWREQNPRWVYGTNLAKDEKDIEFAVSWLLDVDYAVLVTEELGLRDEKPVWKQKQAAMIQSMRQWFFSNPDKIEQFYFADSGKHATKTRSENVPMMIATALCRRDLPNDLSQRTDAFFRATFDPTKKLGGFNTAKHPDLNLTAYGLLDRGMPEAKAFVETFLAADIRAGEFAEVLESTTPVMAGGVKPSAFSPLNIIEFTWLLNKVRYDSGVPTACEFQANQSKLVQARPPGT